MNSQYQQQRTDTQGIREFAQDLRYGELPQNTRVVQSGEYYKLQITDNKGAIVYESSLQTTYERARIQSIRYLYSGSPSTASGSDGGNRGRKSRKLLPVFQTENDSDVE